MIAGIVSLLFCGITLKHYAYFNMSRRTQLTTKYLFQVISQLSENFIFIYLGLALFTDNTLQFHPPLIIITILAVCAARWVAVFPLSKLINWFFRYRARRRGIEIQDELPYNYQAMLFWAGLRGAVGVALAALLTGENEFALKATILVVVVLTVIIFGGTTARMLEILGIRTGVVDEIDSDDEFDIESFGLHAKRTGSGIGYNPRRNGTVPLHNLEGGQRGASYVSGHSSPHGRPSNPLSRKNSVKEFERADLLPRHGSGGEESDLGSDIDTSDLPPPARRSPMPRASPQPPPQSDSAFMSPAGESSSGGNGPAAAPFTATGAIRQLWQAEDPAGLFRQLDEDYIKPKLLLHGDGTGRGGNGNGNGSG
jgi:sodium/hydrogen exchanger-like protein 6/7